MLRLIIIILCVLSLLVSMAKFVTVVFPDHTHLLFLGCSGIRKLGFVLEIPMILMLTFGVYTCVQCRIVNEHC